MNESWSPSIADSTGPLHERLVHALRQDIATGELEPEGRLPPHRALASRLGIGVGTATRAYAEATRLGLLTSTVGRGTFVTKSASPLRESADVSESGGVVDLSLNLHALDIAATRVAEGLDRIRQRPDLGDHLTVTPHAGIDWHRQTLAQWFREVAQFDGIDWRRLLVMTGAQHGLALAVDTICRPGDIVLTEAATFSGFRALAAHRSFRCVGVAMDGEGIRPDALEAAIAETGSRVLYTMPTLQNPTTRTMSHGRRLEIVRIARMHGLTLIEDDVYAPLAFALAPKRPDVTPLASLAPERTWYVNTLSKAIGMGPRVGILVAPDAGQFERACVAMRANCYTTSTIASLLACQLIKDGIADEVRRAVAQEASTRMTLAERMLGTAIEQPSFRTSLHAWMPLPELRAERVANGAMRRGVILTPPSSIMVDGAPESGLRVCLNAVSRSELERGLRVVRSALADEIMPSRMAIV